MSSVNAAPMSFGATLRGIAKQAWPVLISQWAGISFGVLDTAMTGHSSASDLAAMALSASIYITVFVGLMGVVHAWKSAAAGARASGWRWACRGWARS